VPVPEPSAVVNAPGPLPLLPPAPIPKLKSTPQPVQEIVESQPKPELIVADPIKEDKHTPPQNVISKEELSLSTPGNRSAPPLQAVPAQDSRSQVSVPLKATEPQRQPALSPPSNVPMVSAPVEESVDLAIDTIPAATGSTLLPLSMKLEAEPLDTIYTQTTTVTTGAAPHGSGVLQGPASASRDSLTSVQRRNSKLTSTAKKVSHSVRKVFKGSDGRVIHSDPQRLMSSSSDSVDSQRFTAESERSFLNGGAISKLASSSRESLASTKSRRSLMDGTKKGFKRMFRGSSDNIEVPPVPQLPTLTSTIPDASISSGKPAVVPSASTPAPKPAKSFAPKNPLRPDQHQQAPASVSSAPQSTRNAPGAPDAGNNASPLLKGMFKGRANTRVRR
jgi:hypothetical protein